MIIPALQVFCGMLSRIAQFADIMLDAKQQIDKVTYLVQSHHVEHAQGCQVNPSILQCVSVIPKGDAQRATANSAAESILYMSIYASRVRKVWPHRALKSFMP